MKFKTSNQIFFKKGIFETIRLLSETSLVTRTSCTKRELGTLPGLFSNTRSMEQIEFAKQSVHHYRLTRIAMAMPCIILLIAAAVNPVYIPITVLIIIGIIGFDIIIIKPKVEQANQIIHAQRQETVSKEGRGTGQ